ncbi:MAG: non-homologous end-joining DNA ligase [Chloroflexota bacterium]
MVIVPMLAKLVNDVPSDDDGWAFEMKWDGIRALPTIHDGDIQIFTRNGNDMTARFPEMAGLAQAIGHEALLDGEIVALDERGRPSFQLLQQQHRQTVRVVYMIFDLLQLGSESLLGLPYVERRARLEALKLEAQHWQTPSYSRGGGHQMREESQRRGLEGVIAKQLDSVYDPGKRTGAWLKIKNHLGQELVIAGWQEGLGKRQGMIGALLLGYYDAAGQLQHAGKVGTGFTEAILADLGRRLAPLARETNPFASGKQPRASHFVEPELVAEIEFTEWTSDGHIRHPSFKGLRDDKPARDIVHETPEGGGRGTI